MSSLTPPTELYKPSIARRILHKISPPTFKISIKALKHELFPEEIKKYLELKSTIKTKLLYKKTVTIYYPGSATDIIHPLILTTFLIDAKEINLILVDLNIFPEPIIDNMQRITENSNYNPKNNRITFNYRNKIINITYYEADAFEFLPEELKNGFDLYFERAFYSLREGKDNFNALMAKLSTYYISDHSVPRSFTILHTKKGLGFYKNFTIARKD